MTKTVIYRYLGTNGIVDTPVFIEGTFFVRKIALTADEGKELTKDHKTFYHSIVVNEDEVDQWVEVDKK